MYRLLIIVALLFTGCATNTNQGLRNNGKITVTGIGRTFEEAKNDGFRQAVEIVVGSVIVTSREAKNDNLVKDDILKHSSGYIDDFTVVHKIIEPNRVSLVMDVTVRKSQIAERILGKFSSDQTIPGNRLSSQYQTYLRDRQTGDQLLNIVLDDFPSRAFTVTQGKVEFKLDSDRNAYIIIPYELRWNYNYLVALNEALKLTHDGPDRYTHQKRFAVISKKPGDIVGRTDTYYFNDNIRTRLVKGTFLGPINVGAEVKTDNGRTVFVGCSMATHMGVNPDSDPAWINGNDIYRSQVVIQINKNDPKFNLLNQANNVSLGFGRGDPLVRKCYI